MELLRDNKKMNEMGALIDDGIEGIEERLTEFRRVLSKMEIYFWKKKRFFFFLEETILCLLFQNPNKSNRKPQCCTQDCRRQEHKKQVYNDSGTSIVFYIHPMILIQNSSGILDTSFTSRYGITVLGVI
jgi:hypothetical protein